LINKKLRVALCISGQMRTYLDCIDSVYKHIMTKCNPDVFIHTWESTGGCEYIGEKESDILVLETELKKIYNAKVVVVEKFKDSYFDEIGGVKIPPILKELEYEHAKTFLPMLYKMKKCDQLRQHYEEDNSFKYDFVIRIRPDLKLTSNIPEYVFENRNILWTRDCDSFRINDQYLIASSEIMDKFMSLWEKLEEYWEDPLGSSYFTTHKLGNRLFYFHLKEHNIQFLNFDNRVEIIRFNHSKVKHKVNSVKNYIKKILKNIYLYNLFLKLKNHDKYRSKDKILILNFESNSSEYLMYMLQRMSSVPLSSSAKYRADYDKKEINNFNISAQKFIFLDDRITFLQQNNIKIILITKNIYDYILDLRYKIVNNSLNMDLPDDDFSIFYELNDDEQVEYIIDNYLEDLLLHYVSWYRYLVNNESLNYIWVEYRDLVDEKSNIFPDINDFLKFNISKKELENKTNIIKISLTDANVMKFNLERKKDNYVFSLLSIDKIQSLTNNYKDVDFSHIGL